MTLTLWSDYGHHWKIPSGAVFGAAGCSMRGDPSSVGAGAMIGGSMTGTSGTPVGKIAAGVTGSAKLGP